MGRKKLGSRIRGPYVDGKGWRTSAVLAGRTFDRYFRTREEADVYVAEFWQTRMRVLDEAREPRDCPPLTCTAYAIRSGLTGPIKFGAAISVRKRMHYLQVGNPEPLILLALFCPAHWSEEAIHQRLIAHRGRGEWFAAAPEVVEFIALEHCIAGPGMAALRK